MIYYSPDAAEINAQLVLAGMDPVLYELDKFKSEIRIWVLSLVILAFASAIFNLVCKFAFGVVGENITL